MDIILTGIARSGTTLTCFLLNKLPQAVALHEPMNPADLVGLGYPEQYLERVTAFFSTQRSSLLEAGTAISKARDGRVPENPFGVAVGESGLRASTVGSESVAFGKELQTGFRLVVKHPNVFTATLPALLTRFPCFAVIRNPLAVLLSWQTIQAPVNRGRLPFGEAFDPALEAALADESDRVARQLVILRWYFSRYASMLPRDHVLRYEEIVASGGRVLAVIDPDAASLGEPLESRNRSALYDADLVNGLAERLLADEGIYDAFYPRSAVESLRDEWLGCGPRRAFATADPARPPGSPGGGPGAHRMCEAVTGAVRRLSKPLFSRVFS
jgi:hypothetical protein